MTGRPALPRRATVSPAACRAGALLAVAALAACASVLPPQPVEGQAFTGRFSLSVDRVPDAGSAGAPGAAPVPAAADGHSWSGRFSLLVAGSGLSLDLVSPFGATIARFETNGGDARLVVPQDGVLRVEHGASLDELARRVLGWSLPLSGMAAWVQGHPDTDRPFRLEDAAGAPGVTVFEQDGWSVRLEEPGAGRAGRLLQARRPAQDSLPAVALRVLLDADGS